jgi:hypothetical protein
MLGMLGALTSLYLYADYVIFNAPALSTLTSLVELDMTCRAGLHGNPGTLGTLPRLRAVRLHVNTRDQATVTDVDILPPFVYELTSLQKLLAVGQFFQLLSPAIVNLKVLFLVGSLHGKMYTFIPIYAFLRIVKDSRFLNEAPRKAYSLIQCYFHFSTKLTYTTPYLVVGIHDVPIVSRACANCIWGEFFCVRR